MKITACITAIVVGAWAASPATQAAESQSISHVNGSVSTTAGQTYDTLSSVNGNVHVETGVTADEAHTVNGDIVVESDAKVGSVKTVNGSLRIGAGVAVAREASTPTMAISISPAARACTVAFTSRRTIPGAATKTMTRSRCTSAQPAWSRVNCASIGRWNCASTRVEKSAASLATR